MSDRVRWSILALALATTLALAAVAIAGKAYKGSVVGDPETPVKAKKINGGQKALFEYRDVLVHCTGDVETRQGGASHTARLNDRRRFKDTLTDGAATSKVKGKIKRRRAKGTLEYHLTYDDGECHSGVLEWEAKR
jgi:hypothetical protein